MPGTGEHLRFLARAAVAAGESATFDDALGRVVAEVCALTGWRDGRGPGDGRLHRVPVRVGDEAVAELAFRTGEAEVVDDGTLEALNLAAELLSRVAERERLDRRYRSLASSVWDGVLTLSSDGTITAANAPAERMLGYGSGDLEGRPAAEVVPGLSRARLGAAPVTLPGVRSDGVEIALQVTRTDGPALVLRDPPQRPRDQIHDPLTGLANRLLLRDRLEHALAAAEREGAFVAVAVADIDRFRTINDSFGPAAGDAVLVAVATRLLGTARAVDTVAREGSDEFAVVFEGVAGEAEALRLVTGLTAAFAAPIPLEGGRELVVSLSTGAAVSGDAGVDAGGLLRRAEVARERARHRGPGQLAVYDGSMHVDTSARASLEHDLRAALDEGQLFLQYQPIVDLRTRGIAGVEALVRWHHPARGLLGPRQFISAAEESGLIVPLGRWVLEQACLQAAAWPGGRAGGVSVSVNVSARQFRQDQWAGEVARALADSGLEPGRLVLEITESLLMEDLDTTRVRLSQLRRLGVRIAIDDFGTGYSSLGYLRHLPVDVLKVDKSFVDGVAGGPHESALARAVIKLAAMLDLDAVAEGVSDSRQAMQLRRLRCRFGQGYLFSPPVDAEAVTAMLAGDALVVEAPGA